MIAAPSNARISETATGPTNVDMPARYRGCLRPKREGLEAADFLAAHGEGVDETFDHFRDVDVFGGA